MSTYVRGHARACLAAFAVIALMLVAAACGGSPGGVNASIPLSGPGRQLHRLFPGLHVRYGGVARLAPAIPPASAALPGANDLLAAGSATLAATSLGIFRSTDGGATWRRVLSGLSAWSLTAAGGGYAAMGNLPGKLNLGPPVLAVSRDGVRWRIKRITGTRSQTGGVVPGSGYRFALSGLGPRATGTAVPDITSGLYPAPTLRSSDGGLTWRRVGRDLPPGGFSGVAVTSGGKAAFVTAPGNGARCAGAVYRSADGGATWSVLGTSCEPYPLTALQFLGARHGFAAGGLSLKVGGGSVVESTSDGGRTWHTLLRTRTDNGGGSPSTVGYVRLDMVSARAGWAIADGCEIGENGPCDGAVVVTADGGHRWTYTRQGATSVVGLGPRVALAGNDRLATLGRTADGGRIWSEQSPPKWIATSAFSGSGSTDVWATSLGDFVSTSAASAWVRADQLGTARYAFANWLAGSPHRLLGYTEAMQVVSSRDGGQTLTTSRVPDSNGDDILQAAALGTGGRAIVVTGSDAQCASAAQVRRAEKLKPGWKPPSGASTVFTSADGGAHWNSAGSVLPFGVLSPTSATVDGPLIAIIDACNRLQLSTDGGLRWHGEAIAKTESCTVSALWLSCQAGDGGFWVLHSADRGATWTAFWLRAAAAANGLSPLGSTPQPTINPGGVFPTGPAAAVMPAGGSLWRTTDGGRSWRQYWPPL
jgi:hypothetical protein